MGAVSLIDTGVQLGRTSGQEVRLGSLRDDGYSRTFGVSGYLRVNPYEEAAGRADDPDRVDSLHYLGNWENYDHDRLPHATDLEMTPGYGEVTLDWVGAAGHDSAPLITGYFIYVKDTSLPGSSTPTSTELSVDPTDTPDQTQQAGFAASAVETDDVDLASYNGNWVAVAVVVRFNDSVTVHEDTEGASAKTGEYALIGAFEGILARAYRTDPGPISCTQTTDPDSCAAGDPVNLRVQVDMEGTSTGRLEQQENGGSWTLVDSGVAAGTSQINLSRTSGNYYKFRLRYNDVSPDDWATQTGTTSAICNLV